LSQGDAKKAIATFQAIPSLNTNKEALNSLFHAYRQQGDLDRAMDVAQQLFDNHEDFAGLALVAEDLVGKGDAEKAFAMYQRSAQRLLGQGAFRVLIEGLRKILTTDSSNIAVLELLWSAYRRTGDVGEGRETAELLAHAYMNADQLDQAREVYAELVALEPDNAEHRRLLRQVEARLRGAEAAEPVTAVQDATPLMAMELAAAPEEESTLVETLPPREQALVKNCLTESELYLTYHQMPRAIETLENGLLEVPGNVALYEHLLPLYEQTQQYLKAARCAQALTEAYVKTGDGERAARYGELIVSYQQKAKESETAQVVEVISEANMMEAETAPPPSEAPAEQSRVREIDLSMEWASLSEAAPASSATATADSLVEEIEFYLQAGLVSEAAAAVGRLREHFPSHRALAGFEERVGALPSQAASVAESPSPGQVLTPEPEEAVVQEVSAFPNTFQDTLPAEMAVESEAELETAAAPTVEEEPALMLDEAFQSKEAVPSASGFELALEENPAVQAPPPRMSPAQQPAAAAPVNPFASLAGEEELKLDLPPKGAAAAGAQAPPAGPSAGFLDDIFAEFKEDVGEPASADDLETHYNMGVAFKEMALYDEAIGEFQKVHQLAESAKDYSHVVQCCSLLATCFLEKGMPQLAVKWYQTALGAPGVDAEASLAILYEMGCAYEVAGDPPAALKSFLEVYARNIDYRNVAERIRGLQQSSS
jgi:tetratricopeptide (TPR) repeat protein